MFSRSILVLLAAGSLAAPAAADRLYVAGADGFVMRADTTTGRFSYFACACVTGPIEALAADGQRLYAAGDLGQLGVFDLDTGALQGLFFLGVGPIRGLAAADGAIFVGTEAGAVVRVDPASGAIVATRPTPAGVRSLVAHKGFLLAATADGAIYRAPVTPSEVTESGFQYFTCFCFSGIQDMAVVGGDLLVGDGNGTVARVSVSTGNIITAFWVGALDSMAESRGALLSYYTGAPGQIPRFDANTGQQLASNLTSPIDVRAMLVLRDEPSLTGTKKAAKMPTPQQLP